MIGLLLANAGWPTLLLKRPDFAFFVVAWGLLLEYPGVRLATGFEVGKAAVATLAMNATSALAGFFLLQAGGATALLQLPPASSGRRRSASRASSRSPGWACRSASSG